MARVRIGLAGAGHWARTAHLPTVAAHPEADLVAVADPDPANLDQARRRYGLELAYPDPHDMLAACDLDAVIVATPHAHHFAIALDAVQRGRHVLVEKPLVLDPADGRTLMAAATTAGVEIVVGYPWHYNEQARQVRDWIAEGRLGALTYVQSFFGSSPINLYRGDPAADVDAYGAGSAFDGPLPTTYSEPGLAGGGQGQTQLTHSLALLLFMTGLRPARVAAFMDRQGTAVDVIDALTIRFDGGALGTLGSTGSVVPRSHTDTLEYILHGTLGHLHFDVTEGSLRLFVDGAAPDPTEVRVADRYPMWRPAENLIEVALGRSANGSPVAIGQATVEVLDAAYRSAGLDGQPMETGGTRS